MDSGDADGGVAYTGTDADSLGTALLNDPLLDFDDEDVDAEQSNAYLCDAATKSHRKSGEENEILECLDKAGMWTSRADNTSLVEDPMASVTSAGDRDEIDLQTILMKKLGKDKRPPAGPPDASEHRDKRQRVGPAPESDPVASLDDYLIVDEISMISAELLTQICLRINQAKAGNLDEGVAMFGSINVIFLGDMGQLRPVRAKSVFAHDLVQDIIPNVLMTAAGQESVYGAWLWRMVTEVVILRKNWRALSDPEYTNLLARVRLGLAYSGYGRMSRAQVGVGSNYSCSDYRTLQSRRLQRLSLEEAKLFEDAPIIVGNKVIRDCINKELVKNFAHKTKQPMYSYHARDRFNKLPVTGAIYIDQGRHWADTSRNWGQAEGTVAGIKYTSDADGHRYATCVYVRINGSGIRSRGLDDDIVPIVPVTSSFIYKAQSGQKFSISRTQLPLVPAYAYTDYKSQGRSLQRVIVDLASARSLQSLYVMISRASSLKAVAVFRNFTASKVNLRLGQDFRREFDRLEALDASTKSRWEQWAPEMVIDALGQTGPISNPPHAFRNIVGTRSVLVPQSQTLLAQLFIHSVIVRSSAGTREGGGLQPALPLLAHHHTPPSLPQLSPQALALVNGVLVCRRGSLPPCAPPPPLHVSYRSLSGAIRGFARLCTSHMTYVFNRLQLKQKLRKEGSCITAVEEILHEHPEQPSLPRRIHDEWLEVSLPRHNRDRRAGSSMDKGEVGNINWMLGHEAREFERRSWTKIEREELFCELGTQGYTDFNNSWGIKHSLVVDGDQ
ncbi:hypothetical protein C8J57DRAFT_1216440 [Mycena rebaudengoi]|nr:hypothetical protein C8J57DRAFT_1216440 [Mycena rebaudengoi]